MTYELRTYIAAPGKLDALLERFRSLTLDLFAEYGIRSLGYWTPVGSDDTLVYLVQHDGDPKAAWAAFGSDQRWIDGKAASEVNGPLSTSIESVMLEATDLYPVAEPRQR